MTEFLIKNIISEIMFNSRVCESVDDQWIVNYVYDQLLLEKLLYGEPITVPELRSLLRKKILNFEFIKLDGEVRPAKGTTMMKYVPPSQHPKGIRPSSPKVATFFDLKKDDWRSVSQRSKEIVLKKDEETGKPVVMVKDKPEAGEVPVQEPETEPTETPIEEPIVEPTETPIEEPTEVPEEPVEQPEIDVDGQPLNPEEEPETVVKSIKPVESTDEREIFYFVNPETGASKQIEMTPAEVIKELKKLGKGWELSEEEPIVSGDEEIGTPEEPEEDELNVGDRRNYLNRFGENVEIEIVNQDDNGNYFAKPIIHYTDVKGNDKTKIGPEFIIPQGRMQNIGSKISKEVETDANDESIIDKLAKKENLDNIEADEL